jgi:hypothetical protein
MLPGSRYRPRDGTADSLPGEVGATWFLARTTGSTTNTDMVNDSTAGEAVTDSS